MTATRIARLPWRLRLLRGGVCAFFFLLGVAWIPRWWCAREAQRWYNGDTILQQRLAHGVARWLTNELTRSDFATGSSQFNGEWLFGTYMMGGMGFGQTALEHPEWRTQHLARMDQCIQKILSPQVRAFDRESWDNDPIESLDTGSDHAAFLGYFNLLLSLQRLLDPKSMHAELNNRITAALARRLERSPIFLLQTYPNEVYPVDNAAVIGSIGLYDRATGSNHQALVQRWIARCRQQWMDPKTGLIYQAVETASGQPSDAPRGSGTCLSAYFLSFADAAFSAELYRAVKRSLSGELVGFGLVREYPRTVKAGAGDIDSGPVLFGYGVSATGFCLAGSRIHHDLEYFTRLYRMVHLFGAPRDRGGTRHFVSGGPIGDAILFAMLTAPSQLPAERKPGS